MPTELLYRIVDEPRGSAWRSWVVKPFWPWLALFLGGSWVGAPWFIFNAIAMGSPTRTREIIAACAVPLVMGGGILGMGLLAHGLQWPQESLKYLVLPGVLLKLALGYYLFMAQSRAFQLHEHFGQGVRNGAFVLMGAFFLRERVLEALPALLRVSLM